MLMATIKMYNWKGREVVNMKSKDGRRVMLFTNKYTKIPKNIINLGAKSLRGWLLKQDNLKVVTVYEDDNKINLSLVTKKYYQSYKK